MADRRNSRSLAPIGLGVEFAALLVAATVLGLWVDRHYDTAPWGSVLGALAGLAGGLYHFLRSAQRAWRRSSESSEAVPDGEREGSCEPDAGRRTRAE